MTELEYVTANFEHRFAAFRGKRIILHGSRDYAEAIIAGFNDSFCFAGIMSRDPLTGPDFCGVRILKEKDLFDLDADLIILTERVKYAEAVYQDIAGICARKGILLKNMYGVDEISAHHEYEIWQPLNNYGWKRLFDDYQVVLFETIGSLFEEPEKDAEKLILRLPFFRVVMHLLDSKADVKFSLRKSFSADIQRDALKKAFYLRDIEEHIVYREGEDLSFRSLCEKNPGKKILYVGGSTVANEWILPKCYGIDTVHPQFIPEHKIYDSFVPVDELSGEKEYEPAVSKKDIIEMIRQHDVISFDIFETLLIRKTLYPEDVFFLVENRAKERGIPLSSFPKLRMEAGRSEPEININEIYGWLRELYDWDAETASRVMQLEIEAETDVLKPKTEAVKLLETAVSAGKKVILVSDMYLPASVIRELLVKNGIRGWDEIYVSCDFRKSKQAGLFGFVCRSNQGKSILHIGDDPAADKLPCEAYGIHSVILPSGLGLAKEQGWAGAIAKAKTPAEHFLLGTVIADLFNDPFRSGIIRDLPDDERLYRYSHSVIGPIAAAYLCWLIIRIRRLHFDAVLFLSRDGWLFREIYENLRPEYKLPPSVYFYMNRHAAFLSCADDAANIRYAAGMAGMDHLSGPEVLSRIYGLPPEKIEPEQNGESFEGYINRHMPEISRAAAEAEKGLRRYYRKCGLVTDGFYALVDFIAKGTTQMFLEKSLCCRYMGYCFANYYPAHRHSDTIDDYLLTGKHYLLDNYMELESFITSPEPSVDHLTPDGEIVFAEEVRTKEDIRALKLVLSEAGKFALEYFRLFYQEGDLIDPDLIDEMFAADGCHWVQRFAWNDWSKSPVRTKPWQKKEDQPQ